VKVKVKVEAEEKVEVEAEVKEEAVWSYSALTFTLTLACRKQPTIGFFILGIFYSKRRLSSRFWILGNVRG
jgi:hypothetical protein